MLSHKDLTVGELNVELQIISAGVFLSVKLLLSTCSLKEISATLKISTKPLQGVTRPPLVPAVILLFGSELFMFCSNACTLEILTCCKRVETTRTFVLVADTAKVCSTRYCRVMFLACCFLACCTNNTDLVCCLETHLGVLCTTRSWRVLGLSS